MLYLKRWEWRARANVADINPCNNVAHKLSFSINQVLLLDIIKDSKVV
jgi:hypothetical protein